MWANESSPWVDTYRTAVLVGNPAFKFLMSMVDLDERVGSSRGPAWRSSLGTGPPQPAQSVGQEDATVVGAVAAIAEDQAEIVAGFREGGCNAQVVGEPVPLGFVPVQVAVACLHEDAQRLAGDAGDQVG